MKKMKKAYTKLWQEFMGELSDDDLQNNYDSFKRSAETKSSEYKELLVVHQTMEAEMGELKDALLISALNGISTEALSRRFRELESASDELLNKMNVLYASIKYYEDLMHKYVDWSERKLFLWWNVFKTINDDTTPWSEWKNQFDKNLIF